MQNTSGFIPVGHRLLVLPDKAARVSAGGIELVEETTGRDEMAQIRGIAIAVGAGCWLDTPGAKELGQWVKPGDRVIFGKYSGLPWLGRDGDKYRIINDLDVVGLEVSDV